VGRRSYRPASGAENWTFTVRRLHSGTNVVLVRAVDATGLSTVIRVTIERQ